jgi:hypothetical protein
MYSKIRAKVKLGNWMYEWIDDECGTNQGGPINTNMFKNMLDDLRDFLDIEHGIVVSEEQIIVHMLWADDLILLADSAKGLQRHLDGLYKFCSKYQLIVNSVKTKIMIFGKPAPESSNTFMFNGKLLVITDCYKNLGVIFNLCYKAEQMYLKGWRLTHLIRHLRPVLLY